MSSSSPRQTHPYQTAVVALLSLPMVLALAIESTATLEVITASLAISKFPPSRPIALTEAVADALPLTELASTKLLSCAIAPIEAVPPKSMLAVSMPVRL